MLDSTRRQFHNLLVNISLPLYILVIAWMSVALSRPPEALSPNAAEEQFSAGRALEHVRVIAKKPHPLGSQQNRNVRDYLVSALHELNLEVEVQRTEVIYDYDRYPDVTAAATVENIVGRLKGSAGNSALMLMSHYDSVPSSPGANDAAHGVAAILETLRALRAQSELTNDVIILLSDGEELGLFGVQAFVRQHRWASDVELAINIEARGSSGPVVMFETGPGNEQLIDVLATATPYPRAYSFAYEIYRRMPNDTDLSITKSAGIQGMNFGYNEGFYDYHTMTDNIDNLALDSLQQVGSNVLALTRAFGDRLPDNSAVLDSVYFNLGPLFIHYPLTWSWTLAAVVLLLVGLLIRRLFVMKRMSSGDLGRGMLAQPIILISIAIALGVVFTFMGGSSAADSETYFRLFAQQNVQVIGFAVVAVSLTIGIYRRLCAGLSARVAIGWPLILLGLVAVAGTLTVGIAIALMVIAGLLWWLFRNPTSGWGLSLGSIIFWAILVLLLTITVTGAANLFCWPLIPVLISSLWLVHQEEQPTGGVQLAVIYAAGSIGLFMFAELTWFLYLGVGVNAPQFAVLPSVLVIGLIAPAVLATDRAKNVWDSVVPAVAGLALLAYAALNVPFDSRHPKPNDVFYWVDADSNQQWIASTDQDLDSWQKGYFGTNTETAKLDLIMPGTDGSLWLAPAAGAVALPPQATLTSVQSLGEGRRLILHIESPSQAEFLSIAFDRDARFTAASLNGKPIRVPKSDGPGWWNWWYFGVPADGIKIELVQATSDPVSLQLTDVSYRWPEGIEQLPRSRPEYMMRRQYAFSDATVTTRSFRFD